MTEKEFCYWLQGFIEIENPKGITASKLEIIKDHLKLVFTKVTPNHKVPDCQSTENAAYC